MIRRLRYRLVLASMLSLLAVLTVIMGGLNVMNYQRIVRDSDGILALLGQNGGDFPSIDEDYKWPERGPGYRSRELPFELRFFSVLIDAQGGVAETDVERIAAVDEEAARDYALGIHARDKRTGFVDIYRFLRVDEAGGGERIVFLDCGRTLSQWRNALLRSVVISAVGLCAVFLLIVLLSGQIVRPIARSYEKQKRFISDAGHEIKTPITIIDADAEILEMDLGENEWLMDIRQQSSRLAELTNDLIFLSRMEEQEKAAMIGFPLSDVVSEAAASFQSLALTRGKRFALEVEPMLSMEGNEKQIRQLVSILLDNAMKYSDDRGEIRLELKRHGKTVRLAVANSTDGISKETIGNMFERFYRGDPSRNSAIMGYGIGLSIARAIVEAHRGKIAAESPDGRTLTVTAAFPVERGEKKLFVI